mgnify:CR=1 FL=1
MTNTASLALYKHSTERPLSHLVHLIVVVQPEEEEADGVADRLGCGDLVAEEDRREEHQPRLELGAST